MGSVINCCHNVRESENSSNDNNNYECHGCGGYLSSRESNNSRKSNIETNASSINTLLGKRNARSTCGKMVVGLGEFKSVKNESNKENQENPGRSEVIK